MAEQPLDRPLARDERLHREPDERDHREPAVLDLLDGVGVRVHPGRVEREDGVLLARLPGLEAGGLEEAEDDLLDGDEAEDGDSCFFFFPFFFFVFLWLNVLETREEELRSSFFFFFFYSRRGKNPEDERKEEKTKKEKNSGFSLSLTVVLLPGEEPLGLDAEDLLAEDAGDADHGPARVGLLGLDVPKKRRKGEFFVCGFFGFSRG